MDYIIREMRKEEYGLLEDFLYEAIFIPEGVAAPERSIIRQQPLQVYITDFGKEKDDIAFVAEIDGKVAGAVWARIMDDYGHIDDHTPSLAISLYKEYRGLGMGSAMLGKMLSALKEKGYARTSLAVQKENYAVKMYQKAGFEVIDENEEEYIMVFRLQ